MHSEWYLTSKQMVIFLNKRIVSKFSTCSLQFSYAMVFRKKYNEVFVNKTIILYIYKWILKFETIVWISRHNFMGGNMQTLIQWKFCSQFLQYICCNIFLVKCNTIFHEMKTKNRKCLHTCLLKSCVTLYRTTEHAVCIFFGCYKNIFHQQYNKFSSMTAT